MRRIFLSLIVLLLFTAAALAQTPTATPTAVPISVTITPFTPTVPPGTTMQLLMFETNSWGQTQLVTASGWSSSATGVATVSATGVVTGIAVGKSTITGVYGSLSNSITVTVP